jgi:hypothetical protein
MNLVALSPCNDTGHLIRHITSDHSGIPGINGTSDVHAVGHRVVLP